jgi:hypothetical protein
MNSEHASAHTYLYESTYTIIYLQGLSIYIPFLRLCFKGTESPDKLKNVLQIINRSWPIMGAAGF